MADTAPPRTPTPPNVTQPGQPDPSQTFTRSASRRALFEGDNSYSSLETTPPPESGASPLSMQSLSNMSFLASTINTISQDDANLFVDPLTPATDLSKYRRIAEQASLHGDQADAAVAVALMTPRTARVQLFSTLTQGINLLAKLRETQQKNWEIPSKVKNRMHQVVRLALLTPMPSCYKDELPLLVICILIKDGTLSKDYETRHEQRAKIIMKEVATYAGRVCSEMKNQILGSMKTPYSDTLMLTKALCKACGKDIKFTKELLGAVAYLRGIMALQAEGRTAVTILADRDVWWDLLEHHVKNSHERYMSLDARAQHLQHWVQEDQTAYGSSKPEDLATLAPLSTSLQATVFDSQFKGVEGLEKDILLMM